MGVPPPVDKYFGIVTTALSLDRIFFLWKALFHQKFLSSFLLGSGYFASSVFPQFGLELGLRLGLRLGLEFGLGLGLRLFWHLRQNSFCLQMAK